MLLPGLPRYAQHRALARAGVTHNKRQIPIARDMRERGPLLVPKLAIAQRRILRRCTDTMTSHVEQVLGRALHPLLSRQHCPRGEALAPATVLAQAHDLSRGL